MVIWQLYIVFFYYYFNLLSGNSINALKRKTPILSSNPVSPKPVASLPEPIAIDTEEDPRDEMHPFDPTCAPLPDENDHLKVAEPVPPPAGHSVEENLSPSRRGSQESNMTTTTNGTTATTATTTTGTSDTSSSSSSDSSSSETVSSDDSDDDSTEEDTKVFTKKLSNHISNSNCFIYLERRHAAQRIRARVDLQDVHQKSRRMRYPIPGALQIHLSSGQHLPACAGAHSRSEALQAIAVGHLHDGPGQSRSGIVRRSQAEQLL